MIPFFFNKTNFFFLICISFTFNLNAQNIDSSSSYRIYPLLNSCHFDKTIIDGRDSAMFYSGHIKNAVFIDAFNQNAKEALQKYLNEDTLIVYCTNQKRSEMLIECLKSLNYNGLIIYMQDGMTGWKKNHYDIIIPLLPKK